jgi:hypothetical protein
MFTPVCGTDGVTYTNHCMMRMKSCRQEQNTRVQHAGECGEYRNFLSICLVRYLVLYKSDSKLILRLIELLWKDLRFTDLTVSGLFYCQQRNLYCINVVQQEQEDTFVVVAGVVVVVIIVVINTFLRNLPGSCVTCTIYDVGRILCEYCHS